MELYLLNEVDARLKVEPKVDELPFNALLLVLLLLQDEHVMVEELLELLVGEVDAQLLKRVHLKPYSVCRGGKHTLSGQILWHTTIYKRSP